MAGYTERWVVNHGVIKAEPSVEWRGQPISSTTRPRSFSLAAIKTSVRPSQWRERPLLKISREKRLG